MHKHTTVWGFIQSLSDQDIDYVAISQVTTTPTGLAAFAYPKTDPMFMRYSCAPTPDAIAILTDALPDYGFGLAHMSSEHPNPNGGVTQSQELAYTRKSREMANDDAHWVSENHYWFKVPHQHMIVHYHPNDQDAKLRAYAENHLVENHPNFEMIRDGMRQCLAAAGVRGEPVNIRYQSPKNPYDTGSVWVVADLELQP